jgi:hypothetical protein
MLSEATRCRSAIEAERRANVIGQRWTKLARNAVSAPVVIRLCVPSLLFVLGDWIMRFVPETPGSLWFFATVGILGFLVGVLSPLLTAAALAAAIAGTAWRRDLSVSTLVMWLFVALSIWANFRIATVFKRCCI